MRIQYLYSLITILIITSCSSEKSNEIVKEQPVTFVDSSKIANLNRTNPTAPKSKNIILERYDKSEILSYITNDLKLQLNEMPELTFYNEDIVGNSDKDIVVTARLISKAINENGPFNHLNDKNFGYMGKYHYVYVFNKSSQKVERININASAVIPLKISFVNIQKDKKTINIDYHIREASFTFLYGNTPIGFKQLFTWQNYNLKKYQNDKSAVNFISYEKNKNNDLKDILIYDAEISNYDFEKITTNIYEFSPEIKKKEALKRTFFLDTITWKYKTYLKM